MTEIPPTSSDDFRPALLERLAPAFTAFEDAIRVKHPDAVFSRGLEWDAGQVFYQRSLWEGAVLDLRVTLRGLGAGRQLSVVLMGTNLHLDVPPLSLEGESPERILTLAGLMALGFVQLAVLHLKLC